jgi:hypothetical protein
MMSLRMVFSSGSGVRRSMPVQWARTSARYIAGLAGSCQIADTAVPAVQSAPASRGLPRATPRRKPPGRCSTAHHISGLCSDLPLVPVGRPAGRSSRAPTPGRRAAGALGWSGVARGGGAGDDGAGRREGSSGPRPWPPASLARGPRAGDRGAQGRVRAGPADQGRARFARRSGVRVADLCGTGCADRRHPRRASPRPAIEADPGPARTAGERDGQDGRPRDHRGNRPHGRRMGGRDFQSGR